jgi:hypothetical protein
MQVNKDGARQCPLSNRSLTPRNLSPISVIDTFFIIMLIEKRQVIQIVNTLPTGRVPRVINDRIHLKS